MLIGALEQSLELVGVDEGRSLVEETLRILLIDCGERDCEVVFQAQGLLEQNGQRPPLEPGGIIYELLDLEHAAARQQALLDEPGNLFEWVTVQGGRFEMGDDQGDADEQPIHQVTVATFQMAKHPVTNEMVRASAEDFPLGPMIHHVGGERHPAVEKTWFEVYYFALWLGARLPSEAEWEYSARGGAKSRLGQYFFGDNPEDLSDHAWFDESGRIEAHPVDEINPRTGKENLNPLGLANMLSNVLEWVVDDWHGDYEDAPDDGQPWIETPRVAFRVLRGGSWYNGCRYCRSAARYGFAPGNRNKGIGFRLARSVVLGPGAPVPWQ
ncbi:formylglycine-generating enzyme family protein [Desulfosarcina sp.]|uniref:formylglycine-generating enzyme family protein n=1 Tax=Desulfosarcina sp. TaxID=2027861 RepID=UPI0039704664